MTVLRRWGTLALLAVLLATTSPVGGGAEGAAAATSRPRPAPKALVERVLLGAFVDGMQADPAVLTRFEGLVGSRTDVASYYYGFGDIFPGPTELTFADGGRRKVLLSWDMGASPFSEWAAGSHDDYLDELVAAARAYPYTFYVRPWPEMNGDWQPFQPTAAGDRPAGGTYREFRQAWRHVVTYFRAHGVDNVRWVFNPTADTYRGTTPVAKIWPGAKYVDVLGLDGFNWGDSDNALRWRSFEDIFRAQYDKLTALHPTAPVWVCETASKEPGTEDGAPVDATKDKASWIRAALGSTGMRRIKAVVWFQARKERDWRVDSSTSSLRAFRSMLRHR